MEHRKELITDMVDDLDYHDMVVILDIEDDLITMFKTHLLSLSDDKLIKMFETHFYDFDDYLATFEGE